MTTTATTTLHSGGAATAAMTLNQDASISGSKAVGNGVLRENRRSAGGKVEKVTRKLMEVIERELLINEHFSLLLILLT